MAIPLMHRSTQNWQDLYVAALLEGDQANLPKLISKAERAIRQRVLELFNAEGDNLDEEEAIDHALYALHALKRSLAMPDRIAG
jgi:hypothetical protein